MKFPFNQNEILLGRSEGGDIYTAKVEDGIIRGFNGYDLTADYHEQDWLSNCSWMPDVELVDGTRLESGMPLTEFHPVGLTEEDLERMQSAYIGELSYCIRCGTGHNLEEYASNPAWVIADHEVYCKECVLATDVLIEVEEVKDAFKARDVQDIEMPEEFEEVETLFCDSSGCGLPGERALTKKQAEARIAELIKENGTLYAGLTGIGQFQVYLTFYKKAA